VSGAKVAHGERRRQAIAAIREWERGAEPWDTKRLATALGISQAQAHNLVLAMYGAGELTRAARTVKLADAYVLTLAGAA